MRGIRVKAPIRSTLLECLVGVFVFAHAQPANADDQTPQPAEPVSQAYLQSGYGKPTKNIAEAGQNPISGLDNLTIGFNFDGGVGSFDRTAVGVHLQPVVPIGLTRMLALVAILDLNIRGIPDLGNASTTHWGFGDAEPEFYFAFNIGEVFIAPGIDLLLPTATSPFTGAGKWQLGPGLILFWVHRWLVAGLTFTQTFSVGGDGTRPDTWKFSLQPSVFINLPRGTFIMYSPLFANDWKQSNFWQVPVGAGIGKLVRLGEQWVNLNAQGYWNAVSPPSGPTWTVIFQAQLLFPPKRARPPH
jgi:hypothetical protein